MCHKFHNQEVSLILIEVNDVFPLHKLDENFRLTWNLILGVRLLKKMHLVHGLAYMYDVFALFFNKYSN